MRRTITKSTWAEIRTFYAFGLGVREIAIGYAKFFSRSHHAVIRVYDKAANVTRAIYRASFRNGKGINKRQTQQSVEILYVFSVVVPLLQTMRK